MQMPLEPHAAVENASALLGEIEASLKALAGKRAGEVGHHLLWIRFQLASARIGWSLLERGSPDGIWDEPPEHVEVAAGNLVFRSAVTALDLLAATTLRLRGGGPLANGREADVGWWIPKRVESLRQKYPHIADWVEGIQRSDDFLLLSECRDVMTHRRFQRRIRIGGEEVRGLDLDVQGELHDLRELMLTSIRFSCEQVRLFRQALRREE